MPTGTPFNAPTTAKGRSRVIKIRDGTDVAARYFVYKLYEGTDGQPMRWHVLHGLGESAATISRAVERGWVVLQGVGVKPLDRKAALTDEGRRLARRGNDARISSGCAATHSGIVGPSDPSVRP
jgi:hypothetical protein